MEQSGAVVLVDAVPQHGLEPGDVGRVLSADPTGAAIDVEFVTLGGETVAVLSLLPSQVRAANCDEIAHVRGLRGDANSVPTRPCWGGLVGAFDRARRLLTEEDLALLPTDAADEHDHYIYGTPKRRP